MIVLFSVNQSQDSRAHKLALQYTGCGNDLQPVSGFVGIFHQIEDLTGVGCANATMSIMKELCCPQSKAYLSETWQQ